MSELEDFLQHLFHLTTLDGKENKPISPNDLLTAYYDNQSRVHTRTKETEKCKTD